MQIRRLAVTLAASAVLTSALAPAALAADTTVTVTGGTLTVTNPLVANFPGVTLNGSAQTVAAAMDAFSATDGRGSGAGWNVTVQATRFSEVSAGAIVVGGKQLPASSLTMPAPTVAANGTTSAAPTITAGPYTLDAGSAVKIASAAVDTGMGKYDFTQGGNLSLSVPSTAYAKTYKSTVTVSAVTGP
jgi:X-Pro dipeptidyl-peptidase